MEYHINYIKKYGDDNSKHLEYDFGILFVVNFMKAVLEKREDLKTHILFLCDQYQIHYGEKVKDHVKNPHVEWVLKNYA